MVFEEQTPVPPTIVADPPVGSIRWFNLDELLEQDSKELRFRVTVRYENIQRPLTIRKRIIDEMPTDGRFSGEEIPSTGALWREERDVIVEAGQLQPAGTCHLLEIAVSESFFPPQRVTKERWDVANPPDAVAKAVWWLWDSSLIDRAQSSEEMDTARRTLVDSCAADDAQDLLVPNETR